MRSRLSPLGAAVSPPEVPAVVFFQLPHSLRCLGAQRWDGEEMFLFTFFVKILQGSRMGLRRALRACQGLCKESPPCLQPAVPTARGPAPWLQAGDSLTSRAHPVSSPQSIPFQAFLVPGLPFQVQLTESIRCIQIPSCPFQGDPSQDLRPFWPTGSCRVGPLKVTGPEP